MVGHSEDRLNRMEDEERMDSRKEIMAENVRHIGTIKVWGNGKN